MDTMIKRENCLEDSKLAKQATSVGRAGLNVIRITCKKYKPKVMFNIVFKILVTGKMSTEMLPLPCCLIFTGSSVQISGTKDVAALSQKKGDYDMRCFISKSMG